MTLRWRPHTELPPDGKVITALLCTVDEDGTPYLLGGFFCWRRGEWRQEEDNHQPRQERYWWLPEDELLVLLTP